MLTPPNPQRWQQLVDVPLPEWLPVRQIFPAPEEADVAAAVRRELARPEIARHLRPGLSVALGVGSRGLAALPTLVAATVAALRDAGCEPFIVPAMGSHGGATAAGQQQLLAEYGITETAMAAPIRSSLDVVQIGTFSNGLPLYFDRLALAADLVLPINRVKSHTSFHGPLESGLTKMLAIGFGNHAGATTLHNDGFASFPLRLAEADAIIRAHTPFRFGLASVENAYNRVACVEALPAETLATRESELLALSKRLMARLQFEELDMLVVGLIGKNISGTGMDPNVTGRFATGLPGSIQVRRIVALGLTPETHGNATGLGMVDVTTERVVGALDLDATWINGLTSTMLQNARIPVFMPNDMMAIQLALKTCNLVDLSQARIVWIRNTLELETIYLSAGLWQEIAGRPGFGQAGEAAPVPFDAAGNLLWPEG